MKNRVFRCIEGRARGFTGLLTWELLVGFLSFGVSIFAGHPLIGAGLGALFMFLLSVWRRRDADRPDYAWMGWRLAFEKTRLYRCDGPLHARRDRRRA